MRVWARLVVVLAVGLGPVAASPGAVPAPASSDNLPGGSAPRVAAAAAGNRPLLFVENRGQVDAGSRFYARSAGEIVWLLPTSIVFDLVRPAAPSGPSGHGPPPETSDSPRFIGAPGMGGRERFVVRQDLLGSHADAWVHGAGPVSGVFHFLSGNDPQRWRIDVPAHAEVVYDGLWEGIDLRLYGNGGGLEQEFIVRPGGDPHQIRVGYDGIEGLVVAPDGSLVIHTAHGDLRESAPRVYQEIDGRRVPVDGRFRLLAETAYTFELGPYQADHALIIDPTLTYATFLGGGGTDAARAIAVDAAGNVYLVGSTNSGTFPTAGEARGPARGLGTSPNGRDVFVAKLDPAGATLLYATYLGGTDEDVGTGIAVDGAGNAYVTGSVKSSDFPTRNALRPTRVGGPDDAFVAKLSPTGALVYSTYLGNTSGDSTDSGRAIAVDAAGAAYVTGFGAYVKKLNPAGSALVYETLLSASAAVEGRAIAVDATGNAYIAGHASTAAAARFRLVNALQPTHGGGPFEGDAIVAKLSPTGAPVYATFLGGRAQDSATGIAVDAAGNAYVTGTTASTGFPVTNGALQPALNSDVGLPDAFVTKLNPGGSALVYSTYLGGSNADEGKAIAVDAEGSAFVTGRTASGGARTPFPTTPDAFQPRHDPSGPDDAFLAKLNPSGTALAYGTYLGGNGQDEASGVALDAHGDVLVAGFTRSTNLPTTPGVYQPRPAGGTDAFVIKLGVPASPGATATPTAAAPSGAQPTPGATATPRLAIISAPPTPIPGGPTPVPVSVPPPQAGSSIVVTTVVPDTPSALTLPLPSGQQVTVAMGADVTVAVRAAQPDAASAQVAFDVAAPVVVPVAPDVMGGGQVQVVDAPIDIKVGLRDAAGNPLVLAPEVADARVEVTLPLLPAGLAGGQEGVEGRGATGGGFHWMYEVRQDDAVLGYTWSPYEVVNAAAGTVTIPLRLQELDGTIFLPTRITPGNVQNHDPLVHMWSGPTREARDFGFAGPQFTTFTVVAPQVSERLLVYSPVVDDYAWIDALGVGPSGGPA